MDWSKMFTDPGALLDEIANNYGLYGVNDVINTMTGGGQAAGAGGGALGGAVMGGATGMWDDFSLTTTGGRGLIPYTGGLVPSGYRVANRPARRASPGRSAGAYLVRRRAMNPLNPRALLRAERRMASFTHWVKRHFSIASRMPRRKRSSSGGYRRKRKCR